MLRDSPSPSKTASPRELFLAAMEISDARERAEFLATACQGDANLSSEVETLLGESLRLDGFLESPIIERNHPTTEKATERTSALGDQSGQTIGPYKLLQKIGEGGCGSVYMADQEEPVRRRVALKIIKLGMDTRNVIARFESERQALAMMEHENIARVLDAGATEAGRPYFVMELVRGVSITEYCDRENLTASDRLDLFIQVCNAIQHAHQKGIIHRDIKPSNILVTLHDGVPVPKIIDFGIAKATEQRLTDKTLFTEFHAFIGTPAYMSPEQAEMSGLDIDTRSDIYALGVLLYELLVGRTPFDADTLRTAGLDECRRTIREDEPAPPSIRLATMLDADQTQVATRRRTDTIQLNQLLRGDLDWIVMTCLEKDRRRRYATVSDLTQDIHRHRNGEVVLARPPSTLYRLQKFALRHRGAISAAACLLLTLIAGIATSTWQLQRAREAERIAHVAEANQARLLAQAEEGWEKALSNERAAQLNTYIADVNLTHHALSEGNFGRAMQLIRHHQPSLQDNPGYDFRGFEWRYLAGLCQGDAHIAFARQSGAVQSVVFSPDGTLLATGTDEQVQFWDVRSQSLIATLPSGAQAIAFLSDGQTFVTASRQSVQIWDSDTFSLLMDLPEQRGPIAVSEDQSKLLTTVRGSTCIWDTQRWELIQKLEGSRAPMAFSPDGEKIVASSRSGIQVWHPETGEVLCNLENSSKMFPPAMHQGSILSFSGDGRFIVAPRNKMSEKGIFIVGIWDAATGEEISTMPSTPEAVQHTGVISSLSFSPDGTTLATGSWDHSIRLWDISTRAHLATLRGQSNEVWSVDFAPDSQTIAVGGKDGSLTLWPVRKPSSTNTIPGRRQPLAFNPNGRLLATLHPDGIIEFFDTESFQKTRTFQPTPVATSDRKFHFRPAVAISSDLKTLAQGLGDGSIRIWDTESRESVTFSTSSKKVSFVELSPDGKHLAAGSRDQPLNIWNLEHPEQTEPVLQTEAERVLFSQDGSTLVTLAERGVTVNVWETDTFSKLSQLTISPRPGSSIALSPDGSILATTGNMGDFENAIKLWSTSDGTLLGKCLGHKQGVWSAAFAPDGKTLATASDDSTLKFWNVATQQEMLSIRRVGTTLTHLTFSPNGQWLVGSTSPFATSGKLHLFHSPSFERIGQWLSPET